MSADATTTLVRVINVSDEECKIGCDDELLIACEALITLDVESASSPEQEASIVLSATPRWMSINSHPDTSHVQCMIDNRKSNLSTEQKKAVHKFIVKNVDVFSASEFDLGRTTLVEHRIDLTENKPVHQL